MNRQRFLAKSSGDSIEGMRAGLVKLVEILGSEGYENAAVVVPRLEHVKDTILADILGKILARQLIRDRSVLLTDGKKLSLCSEATLKNYKFEDAYLALWGTQQTIEAIEILTKWKSTVFVTWGPTDSDQWTKQHDVAVIYDDAKN